MLQAAITSPYGSFGNLTQPTTLPDWSRFSVMLERQQAQGYTQQCWQWQQAVTQQLNEICFQDNQRCLCCATIVYINTHTQSVLTSGPAAIPAHKETIDKSKEAILPRQRAPFELAPSCKTAPLASTPKMPKTGRQLLNNIDSL